MSPLKFVLILIILPVYSCKTSKIVIEDCIFYLILEKSHDTGIDSLDFNLTSELKCDSLHIQFSNRTSQYYHLYISLLCEKNLDFEEAYIIDTINKTAILDLTTESKLIESMEDSYRQSYSKIQSNSLYNAAFRTSKILQKLHNENYDLTIKLRIVSDENMNKCPTLFFFSDRKRAKVNFECL